jgi:hypothetical protein
VRNGIRNTQQNIPEAKITRPGLHSKQEAFLQEVVI